MAFNSKGYLDAGLHDMTLDQIEENFVVPFPHSSTRQPIIDGFKRHTVELKGVVNEYVHFIDGSFVTNKNDPGDIDIVCFMDAAMIDALPDPAKQQLALLFAGPGSKAAYLCDAYFCPSYPDTHPGFASYRNSRRYWMGEFGFDRSDVAKGIVVVRETAPVPAAVPVPAGPGAAP